MKLTLIDISAPTAAREWEERTWRDEAGNLFTCATGATVRFDSEDIIVYRMENGKRVDIRDQSTLNAFYAALEPIEAEEEATGNKIQIECPVRMTHAEVLDALSEMPLDWSTDQSAEIADMDLNAVRMWTRHIEANPGKSETELRLVDSKRFRVVELLAMVGLVVIEDGKYYLRSK